MIPEKELKKFTSKGRSFSKSNHHKDMWIVEDGKDPNTGKEMFHCLYASQAEVTNMFPPDEPKKRQHIINLNGRHNLNNL